MADSSICPSHLCTPLEPIPLPHGPLSRFQRARIIGWIGLAVSLGAFVAHYGAQKLAYYDIFKPEPEGKPEEKPGYKKTKENDKK